MLKSTLVKVGSGFLFGSGFTLAMVAIMFAATKWKEDEFKKGMFKDYTPESGLAVTDHRPQRPNDSSTFVGSIENSGKDKWQMVQVSVELFGEDGRFVDKCTDYLEGTIDPGQTRNFKVSCSSCSNTADALAFATYKISIVGATHASSDG